MIRHEQPEDEWSIEQVVKEAFADLDISDHDEHHLVARIRKTDSFVPELSLVAVHNDKIVGHVLLSVISIRDGEASLRSLALAPVSVLPEFQNKGIGGKLIREALQRATALGYRSAVVLGHPDYYPKFGFQRASRWGIKAPFEVPDEVFMALELQESSLRSGTVQYPGAFFTE